MSINDPNDTTDQKSWIPKKAYEPDFSDSESEVIIRTYYHLQHIIGSQSTEQRVSNKAKQGLWSDIMEAVNSVSDNSRKLESIKKRYTNMCTQYKAYRAELILPSKGKWRRVPYKKYFAVFDEFYLNGLRAVDISENQELDSKNIFGNGRSNEGSVDTPIMDDDQGGIHLHTNIDMGEDNQHQQSLLFTENQFTGDEDCEYQKYQYREEKERLKIKTLKLQISILEKQERNLNLEYKVFNKFDKVLDQHLGIKKENEKD